VWGGVGGGGVGGGVGGGGVGGGGGLFKIRGRTHPFHITVGLRRILVLVLIIFSFGGAEGRKEICPISLLRKTEGVQLTHNYILFEFIKAYQ